MNSLGEQIKKYTELGIPTFPEIGKHPIVSWKPFQTRFPTQEEVNEWELNKTITGIVGATGSFSNICVIDCDIKNPNRRCDQKIIDRLKSEGHPETQTGSGGSHFIVLWDASVPTKDGILPGLDLKSTGGCFTLPPSKALYGQDELEYVHFNGNEYKWIKEFKREELKPFPAWLMEMIKEKMPKDKVDWEEVMQGASDGNRNNTAASVCGKILYGLKVEDWESIGWAALEAWNNKCTPPLTNSVLRTTFKSIGRTELARRKLWETGEQLKEEIIIEHKIVSVNQLLDMEEKPEPFILDGMIVEGSVNALTADSGKGKSLVALKMIESIAKGEKFLGQFETKKSKTLVLDLEMSENDIIQRTHSIIQEKMEGLDFYYCQTFNIDNIDDYKWLTDSIINNNYKLIVFDTLSAIHEKEENSNSEMNLVNKKLIELCNKFGVTVLFLHHHKKPKPGEIQNQASSRGAGAIIDKAASHLLLDSKKSMVAVGGDGEQKTGLEGLRVYIEQMKSRQWKRCPRFSINAYYNPSIKKTVFEFGGFDEKGDSAIEKIIITLLDKMEKEEDYVMSDIEEMVGKSSLVSKALKILVEEQKKIGLRHPEEGEMRDGKKIRGNANIFFLL